MMIEPLERRLFLDAGPRLMEYLDRGVAGTRASSSQVFVSWRSLAVDPADMRFNVYRSANGAAPLKLNSSPLTGGTNFSDTSATLSAANSYFIKPVVNNVEQAASGAYTLPANATVAPLLSIPLRNITGTASDYYVQHTWVGDLTGDGEYDFVVARLPTIAGLADIVEAYSRDGALLWTYDAGPNSLDKNNIEPGSTTLSVGHWDGVTVYDLDGNGRAEVAIRTAHGATFGDGSILSHPANSNVQFISVLDGLSGAERARIQVPTDYLADGPMPAHMGVGYLDGVRPSLVVKMKNRIGSGDFNLMTLAYDFDGASITQKWKFTRGGANLPDGHQIRIVDVDRDGRDEIVEIGFVLNGDGTLKYSMATNGIVHGDRFHIGDLDPDRPGLEGYGVQQNNPSGLLEYYYDAATGQILHTRFAASGTADVGRGIAADIDPNHRGYEYWSFSGIYNSKTPVPGQAPVETKLTDEPNRPWPNFRIWWDGDVLSENLNRETIDKWNPATQGTSRVSTLYHYGAVDTWRDAPTFYGDIIGDWREEVVFEKSDHTALQIYTTQIPSSTRLYTLAQNPAYRNSLTIKGYLQSHMLDYYLGGGMSTPPTPNILMTIPSRYGGTGGADRYYLRRSGDNINLWIGGSGAQNGTGTPTHTIPRWAAPALVFDASGGDDLLTIDHSHGDAIPFRGLTFNGGAGADALVILGSTGPDSFAFDTSSVTIGDATATHGEVETRRFDGRGGDDSVIITGGAVTLTAPHRFATLDVGDMATLDVLNFPIIINYSSVSPVGIWNGDAYDGVAGMIKAGRIASSLATAAVTTLAAVEARDALAISGSQTGVFEGQTVDSTSVLLKLTYAGDATLDGKINIDDYGRIDGNVAQSGLVFGWFFGDFNLDGKINIDDYGIIDGNINQQNEIVG